MAATPTLHLSIVILLGAAACSSRVAGTCAANTDCESGEVCADGSCVRLCVADVDCDGGHICDDGRCGQGTREVPVITSVDGDGTEECPDGSPGTHCLAAGLVLTGERFDGAGFTLGGDGAAGFELAVRAERTDTRVELDVPDVAPGYYTLTASNSAGTASQTLRLLQGPPGADGEAFSPTADDLVTLINASSLSIDAARLPVGVVDGTVAAGDHTHDDLAQATTGLEAQVTALAETASELGEQLDTQVAALTASSVPAGAVLPFNLSACPAGWSEFTPAYGRVVRGIDRSGTSIDPAGERTPGHTQGDMLGSHTHTYIRMVGDNSIDGVDSVTVGSGEHHLAGGNVTDAAGGPETRGRNVALLYCQKN